MAEQQIATVQDLLSREDVDSTPHELERYGPFTFSAGDGVYVNADGENYFLCPPLQAVGRSVDENGANPAILVKYRNELGLLTTAEILTDAFESPKALAQALRKIGFPLEIRTSEPRVKAIAQYVQLACQVDKTYVRAERGGWIVLPDGQRQFIYGNESYGTDPGKYFAIRTNVKTHKTDSQGSRDQWLALASQVSHDRLVALGICAAFAAPLLEPLHFNTTMVFFVGPTSKGKTVALRVLASIFSSANNMLTWTGTSNGVEANILKFKDLPCVIDEIGQSSGRQFAELSYRLTNGMSKMRANSKGEAVETHQGRSIIVSAGEESAIDLMKRAGIDVKPGQHARLTTMQVGEPHGIWSTLGEHANGAAKSDFINGLCHEVYGIAGRRFCKLVAPDIVAIEQRFNEAESGIAAEIQSELTFDPEDGVPRRVLRNFVLFAFAGKLAIEKGVLPWHDSDVMDAVRHCYGLWFADYQRLRPKRDSELLVPVRLDLQSNRRNKFKSLDAWRDNHDGVVAGYEYQPRGSDERFFLVFPAYFETHMCGDHSPAAVLDALRNSGFLKEGPRGVPTLQVHMPGSKNRHGTFYAIRQTILLD